MIGLMTWQKYQKRLKTDQKKRQLLLLTFFLLLFTFSLALFRLGRFLISSLPQAAGQKLLPLSWNGTNCVNLLNLTGTSREVWHLCPDDEKLTRLALAEDLLLVTPYGAYPIEKVYEVGQALNPPQGMSALIGSLEDFLNVPIDGYIMQNQKSIRQLADKNQKYISNILDYRSLIRVAKGEILGNLTPWQYLRFVAAAARIRFDKVTQLILTDDFFVKRRLEGVGEVRVLEETALFETLIQKNFAEAGIIKDALTIAVFNNTRKPGLAQKAAKFIGNSGGNVLEIGNLEKDQWERLGFETNMPTADKSRLIVFGKKRNLQTIRRLEDILKVKAEFIKESESQRVDVVVIAGEDFAQ